MSPRNIERRLTRLGTRSGAKQQVVAIRFADSPEVEVGRTTERMTVEEFGQRYPRGIIVKVVHKDLWEALQAMRTLRSAQESWSAQSAHARPRGRRLQVSLCGCPVSTQAPCVPGRCLCAVAWCPTRSISRRRVMPMAGKDMRRRLAALEQATVPADERPMITIVVYDETPDRVIRCVTVPIRPSGGEIDYRKASWILCPGGDEDAAALDQGRSSAARRTADCEPAVRLTSPAGA